MRRGVKKEKKQRNKLAEDRECSTSTVRCSPGRGRSPQDPGLRVVQSLNCLGYVLNRHADQHHLQFVIDFPPADFRVFSLRVSATWYNTCPKRSGHKMFQLVTHLSFNFSNPIVSPFYFGEHKLPITALLKTDRAPSQSTSPQAPSTTAPSWRRPCRCPRCCPTS